MQNDIILQIGNRIKEKRKENSITLQELAEAVGVTKGLISQVENNRTVPSLTVLISIIKALHVDLNEFFDSISFKEAEGPLLIKKEQYETIEREHSTGSHYSRITSFKQNGQLIDVVLFRQEKDAPRDFVSTNAFEYDYMIKGSIKYTIDDQEYILEEGDSFYYDARKPHLTTCVNGEEAIMLVVYIFDEAS
ncbi:MAG: helix-turn-helix transcriptional regulator [Filimonas sp.]|nr:helix-turn-helix transcriptional regulator [Filimonas sp.]